MWVRRRFANHTTWDVSGATSAVYDDDYAQTSQRRVPRATYLAPFAPTRTRQATYPFIYLRSPDWSGGLSGRRAVDAGADLGSSCRNCQSNVGEHSDEPRVSIHTRIPSSGIGSRSSSANCACVRAAGRARACGEAVKGRRAGNGVKCLRAHPRSR